MIRNFSDVINKKNIKPKIKIILIAFLLGNAPIINAHAILVRSEPSKNQVLKEAPKKIDLWFNDGVRDDFIAIAVIDSSGKRVDNHDVSQSITDRANISASVSNLEPGSYTVRYRVVSQDTHIVTGKFEFTISP